MNMRAVVSWSRKLVTPMLCACATACGGDGSSTDNPSPVETAEECLKPELEAVVGTRVELILKDTPQDGPSRWKSLESVVTEKVTTASGYDEYTNVTEQRIIDSNDVVVDEKTFRTVSRLQGSQRLTTFEGFTDEDEAPFQTTRTYEPEQIFRYDLAPNESYTQTYDVRVCYFGCGPGFSEFFEETISRSYLGRETVAVPAGTFEACKFSDEDTSAGTFWVSVNLGVPVKRISETGTEELLSGAINGEPIVGD